MRDQRHRFCPNVQYAEAEIAIALEFLAGRLSVKAMAASFGVSGMAAYSRFSGIMRRLHEQGKIEVKL